jgi:hypothetical protein
MFRREVEQMDAYLIALVMIFIGFLLQIYVWPRIPKSIFKYRGLVFSLSLSLSHYSYFCCKNTTRNYCIDTSILFDDVFRALSFLER